MQKTKQKNKNTTTVTHILQPELKQGDNEVKLFNWQLSTVILFVFTLPYLNNGIGHKKKWTKPPLSVIRPNELYASKSHWIAESYLLKMAFNKTSDISIYIKDTAEFSFSEKYWHVDSNCFYSSLNWKTTFTISCSYSSSLHVIQSRNSGESS